MNAISPIIEAEGLRRTFQQKEAVADVSFVVEPGTIFGLLGPNGAGKTTTIRMLTGQIDPTAGHATVAGFDIVKDRQQLKQNIGVVFEDQILYERLSAYDNLDFARQLYNCPRKRIDEVLDIVRLRDRAKDPIKNFSNGMRQRVMIARALLHQPSVLFLDEPSRGLDPVSARELRKTVQQLCTDAHITVILTTHLMDEADQLCHQVGFVVNGRLVACDTPRNLKLAHAERVITVTIEEEKTFQDYQLSMDDPQDQDRLSQWLRQGHIRAMHSREDSLERVFFKVAGINLV